MVPKPTEAELAILRVLWENGPSTVRQVHSVLSESKAVGYTSVLKLMQIMTEKGLVLRDESGKSHIYRAKQSQEKMQRKLLDDLLERAFAGSRRQLVLQALNPDTVTKEELAEVRALLENLEGK
ncbi:MAG: BlaI/MecI/CopY family transcriptional regulator [Trueperaceae bacterium]|nr:BlaI/MecI/CopY family transcriptional regulator [Trueperaceae bacterium]